MTPEEECAALLCSPRLKLFWDEVRRVQEYFEKEFRSTRKGEISWAFDALDKVVGIPKTLGLKDSAKKDVDATQRK